MELSEFQELREKVVAAGYGNELVWQEEVQEPATADEFMWQYIWVVISSGMKNQVARIIEDRIIKAYNSHQPIENAFGHKGKLKAIKYAMDSRGQIFEDYLKAVNRLEFLKSLPYIGDITKYHLAKNLGEDVVKPDRHLARIAQKENTTPFELCKKLAELTGYRIGTVDIILWRAANLGWI